MDARGRTHPSFGMTPTFFFWYDTYFSEFDSADIIDYILRKSVSYQKKGGSGHDAAHLYIIKNGDTVHQNWGYSSGNDNFNSLSCSVMLELQSGDEVYVTGVVRVILRIYFDKTECLDYWLFFQ